MPLTIPLALWIVYAANRDDAPPSPSSPARLLAA